MEIKRIEEFAEGSAICESSINRIKHWIENHEIALITAFRGKKENVENEGAVKDDGKPVGYRYSHKENRERNRELGAALLGLGYGITKVDGVYIENFGTAGARLSNEESILVVNKDDSEGFFNDVFRLSELYNQDCFCYKAKGDDVGYNVGTNASDYPGYGNRVRNGKFTVGVENMFMTRLGNKGFAFTDADGGGRFSTTHKARKSQRAAKRAENEIDEMFSCFSDYGIGGKQSIWNIASSVMEILESGRSEKRREIMRTQFAILGKMRNVRTICIMPPQNPPGKKMDNGESRTAKKDFERTLKDGMYAFHKVIGKCGQYGESYFVYNISLGEAERMNLEYSRDPFVFAVNNTGEMTFGVYKYETDPDGRNPRYSLGGECTEEVVDAKSASGFFTRIGKNLNFSIPFDDGAFESVSEFLDKYNAVLERYGDGVEEALDECMDDTMSGKGKYMRRMRLYGKRMSNC